MKFAKILLFLCIYVPFLFVRRGTKIIFGLGALFFAVVAILTAYVNYQGVAWQYAAITSVVMALTCMVSAGLRLEYNNQGIRTTYTRKNVWRIVDLLGAPTDEKHRN
jgi:uncharacterized membrane protein YjdF